MSTTLVMSDARLVVKIKEENRDALKLEATLRSVDMGEVIDDLIEAYLTDALEQIRERKNPPDTGPKGRKP